MRQDWIFCFLKFPKKKKNHLLKHDSKLDFKISVRKHSAGNVMLHSNFKSVYTWNFYFSSSLYLNNISLVQRNIQSKSNSTQQHFFVNNGTRQNLV